MRYTLTGCLIMRQEGCKGYIASQLIYPCIQIHLCKYVYCLRARVCAHTSFAQCMCDLEISVKEATVVEISKQDLCNTYTTKLCVHLIPARHAPLPED